MRSITQALIVILSVQTACADVIIHESRESWELAAGPGVRDIGFDEVPSGTWLSDEYGYLGVHFEPWAQVQHFPEIPFDGAMLRGFPVISFDLDEPTNAVGVVIPGAIRFEVFRNGELQYRSGLYGTSHGEDWVFVGLTSSFVFDEVVLSLDDAPGVSVYDLALGAAIPAPGALGLMLIPAIGLVRRRRS